MRKALLLILLLFLVSCSPPAQEDTVVGDATEEELLDMQFSFASADGLMIYGYLSKPEGLGPFPSVILVHGGSPPGAENYTRFTAYTEALHEEGFVTLGLDFRGSSGYGLEFEQKAELGGKEVDDVIAAIDFLETLTFVDTEKIGLLGESHGAFMSLLAAERDNRVKMVVDFYGFADPVAQFMYFAQSIADGGYHDTPEKRLVLEDILQKTGLPSENSAAYDAFSPAVHINDLQVPVLILHGKMDQSVLLERSLEFEELLKEHGKEYEIKIYDNLPHEFIIDDNEEARDALAVTVDFLNRKLR